MAFLVSTNADGSEKYELMVIASSKNPRVSKKKSGTQLGFDYQSNEKASMKTVLFIEWLNRFQNFVARKPDRKGVLLLDNCTAHATVETLPSLRNVCIEFLPPNCKSKIQPMDAGIIAALKFRYRWMNLERILDSVDAKMKK